MLANELIVSVTKKKIILTTSTVQARRDVTRQRDLTFPQPIDLLLAFSLP